MSIEINYSLEYFNAAALAYADKNTNGKIDENEQAIFDEYMRKFDLNSDNAVDDKDVEIYKKELQYTTEQYNNDMENAKGDLLKKINIFKYFEKTIKTQQLDLNSQQNILKYLSNLASNLESLNNKEISLQNSLAKEDILNTFEFINKIFHIKKEGLYSEENK